MPVVTPQVVTDVAKHLRELSDSELDPRDLIGRLAGGSLLEIADILETSGDWSGRAADVLLLEQQGWLEIRKRAEAAGDKPKTKEADGKIRKLGNWASDLNALGEPMTD